MNTPDPGESPKPQPKWSGGPPKPPKITARGLEDGSPKDPDPLVNLFAAEREAQRLMELLDSIRGSKLHALNILEADLDVCVVWLDKLLEAIDPRLRKGAIFHLRQIRDYRRHYPRLENGDRDVREQAKKILDEIG